MQNFVVGRSKLQLCAYFFVVVMLVIFLIYPRTEVYNYYQQQSMTGDNSDGGTASKSSSDNRKYNLMEESIGFSKIRQLFNNFDGADCTLEYMNTQKLQQDHPCVIDTIRRHYLNKPSPPDVPLKLDSNSNEDRSPGQAGVIAKLLKNMTNGFFAECGALDGEYLSNTIDMERKMNWSGILIEANPLVFQKLLSRNRKAWALPICLSLDPYPTQVTFQPKSEPGHSHIEGAAKTLQKPGLPEVDPEMVTVQCFPFYSVLLAVGRTELDFFSLDVEGHELRILKTIPWHKVEIKTLTVEWDNIPDGKEPLIEFMEKSGFVTIGAFDFHVTHDIIFMRDLINTK